MRIPVLNSNARSDVTDLLSPRTRAAEQNAETRLIG